MEGKKEQREEGGREERRESSPTHFLAGRKEGREGGNEERGLLPFFIYIVMDLTALVYWTLLLQNPYHYQSWSPPGGETGAKKKNPWIVNIFSSPQMLATPVQNSLRRCSVLR